jgi:predicted transcriptional regulator
MGSGLEFLHKILKDKTRRKIVLLLNEKGALSHTDLIEELDFINNGRLNYHLKQLNDLLTKDTNRRYILTEKGKLAIRLLTEFPEQNRQQMGLKPE